MRFAAKKPLPPVVAVQGVWLSASPECQPAQPDAVRLSPTITTREPKVAGEAAPPAQENYARITDPTGLTFAVTKVNVLGTRSCKAIYR